MSMLALGLILILGALYWIYVKIKLRPFEKCAAQLPGPRAWPLVGNALYFVDSINDSKAKIYKIHSLARKYESRFRIWLGNQLVVALHNPDDLQIFLNDQSGLAKADHYKFFAESLGEGLLTAPVDKWRVTRKALNPIFSTINLRGFVNIFNQKNKKLMSVFESKVGQEYDIYEDINMVMLETICKTAMGVDATADDDQVQKFADVLEKGSKIDYQRIYKFWQHSNWIFYNFSEDGKKAKEYHRIIHQLPARVIAERIQHRQNAESAEASKANYKIMLDIMLDIIDAGHLNYNSTDLIHEVTTMIIAGSDTTSRVDSFTLLMLAIHQDVQEKAFQEQKAIFGDSDREPTLEDLLNMTYLDMVIRETLRRFPVAAVAVRKTLKPIKLTGDVELPAGCEVALLFIALHWDPKLFPDPERFDPERFTPENVAARHKYSYIPFSGGPRGCIGSKYAMLSIKVTVSAILRRFKLSTSCRLEDIELVEDSLLQSAIGYPVKFDFRI